MKLFYYTFMIFSMSILPLFSAENPVLSEKALLVQGTIRTNGLPGFAPNRISSLFGSYKVDGTGLVSVWATTEPLVFKSDVWEKKDSSKFSTLYMHVADKDQIWAVRRNIAMREELKDFSVWWFVVSFEGSIPEDYCLLFIEKLLARAEFFFSSARRLSDVSFPAVVMLTGNL